MRDLQPRGDAADAGDVRLDEARGGVGLQVLTELADGIQALADGHRNARRRRHGQSVPAHVIGRKRLFEPGQVQGLEQPGARTASSLVNA